MTTAPRGVIWDACGLVNLAATARAEEVLRAMGCQSYVVREVREKEATHLRPIPEEDPQGQLVPIDFTPLLQAGLLQDVTLAAAEHATFVGFAGLVDDGEARTAAVAVHRGLWMATDDRGALRLLRSLSAPLTALTTPEWVSHWATTTGAGPQALGEVLRRIQLCAR